MCERRWPIPMRYWPLFVRRCRLPQCARSVAPRTPARRTRRLRGTVAMISISLRVCHVPSFADEYFRWFGRRYGSCSDRPIAYGPLETLTTHLLFTYSSRSVQQRSSQRSSATFCVSAFACRASARACGAERAGASLGGPLRAGCAGVRCARETGATAVPPALPLQERLGSPPARTASRACLA